VIQRLKPKSEFSRNVLTLMTGTTIAQAIPIAITPFLTRIYTPEDFGAYGFFMAIVLILSIFATAKFEHAMFIVKKEKVTDLILKFTLLNSVIFSLFLLFFIAIFADKIVLYSQSFSIAVWYLIPFAVLIVASYTVLRAWLNKQAEYGVIKSNLIKQSFTYSGLQILFGLIESFRSLGLMLGDILGKGLTTFLILKRLNFKKTRLTKKIYYYFWQKYRLIPYYQVPASLVNTGAMYLPMLFLPFIFSAPISGAFFLVFKVIMAPISIIGNAFLDVFKKDAADAIARQDECTKEFKKTFKILSFIAIVIFLFFWFFSVLLFEFVFGDEWVEAGNIAASLALLAALRFLVAPLSYVVILREKFLLNLLMQLALFLSVLSAMILGWVYNDFYIFLNWYSYLSVLFYLLLLTISFKLAA